MPAITRADQILLDILVEWEVFTADEADVYEQKLIVYRRKHPDVGLADVLARRGLLHAEDLDEALDLVDSRLEAESQPRRRRPAPVQRKTQPRRVAPTSRSAAQRARPAHAHTHPYAPKSDNTVPLVFGAVLIVGAILAGVIFLKGTDQTDTPTTETAQVSEETAADETATNSLAPKATKADPALDTAAGEVRRKIADLRGRPAGDRIRALEALLIDSAPRFESEIQVELNRAQKEQRQRAELQYPRVAAKAKTATSIPEMVKALEGLDEFLLEFGQTALSGKPERQRENLYEALNEECAEQLVAAESAFQRDDYDEAEAAYARVAGSGLEHRVKPAERGLRKIKRRRRGEAAVATANARDDDQGVAKTPSGSDEKAEKGEVAKQPTVKPRSAVDRIGFIRPKLKEFCPSGRAELDNNGMFSVSYDFELKNYEDGEDWGPAIASGRQSHQAAIRWTLLQEEVVVDGMTGVRISDKGVWRHNVKLMPPLKVDVRYYPMNQFNKANQFHVAWVTEKGLGVGVNMGQVTGLFKRGNFTKPSGPLEAIPGFTSYKMGLSVTSNGFLGSFKRKSCSMRPLPAKMTSGFASFVFRNDIAGTIQSVSIRGRLDLDWAEEQLK